MIPSEEARICDCSILEVRINGYANITISRPPSVRTVGVITSESHHGQLNGEGGSFSWPALYGN